MAQILGELKAVNVERLKNAGMHGDGGGLYLQVTAAGAKSWIFRFTLAGKAREMGLGSYKDLGLAEAREKAAGCRRLLGDGVDPIEARRQAHEAGKIAAAKTLTFGAAAEKFIAAHKAGWRNDKHIAQWSSTIATYANPIFGALPIGAVDTTLVMSALEPIWSTKPETAGRVRGRIEAVLDWATVRGYRSGENPARWRGHLDKLLPKRSKVRAVKHHAALPYVDMPAFLARLREADGLAARALEFAVLTAARSGEVLGAAWDEIDLGAKVWTVPAGRMKAGREHKVPLGRRTVDLLTELKSVAQGAFVFPGARRGRRLSNMAMDMTLRRLKVDVTVHGFRSSFRDWAAERSNFPGDVVEMALAHAVGSKVEAAYRRGDLFEKRRRLMDAWAAYCEPKAPANVLPLRKAG